MKRILLSSSILLTLMAPALGQKATLTGSIAGAYNSTFPIGLLLFFALRWGAMYRAITGRVAVNTGDDGAGSHH